MVNVAHEIPLFMTVESCAEVLQINTKAIYKLIREKRLKAKKCGKQWRISREALLNFFNN
ncbi:helix-turn-helix domain-containing protein [Myxococcota bacterium]|nr:helix-turn-helix domain-containing protein [Myxococcota bacterium]